MKHFPSSSKGISFSVQPSFGDDPFSQKVVSKLEDEGLTIKWRYGYKLANRYEVGRIHSGGMGIVWIVEDLFDNRKPYAAKSVKPFFRKPATDDEWKRREKSIQRFLEECKIWVDLEKHRHIVYAEFLEKIEGVPLIMSEYIEGGDLTKSIEKGPSPIETVLDFAIQFCIGMEFANGKGLIVHRDIKPGNIMITSDGVLKINDFGLTKAIGVAEEIGKDEQLLDESPLEGAMVSVSRGFGTLPYMAPEQFSERLLEHVRHPIYPIDIGCDVFAFGLVLYEMLRGKHPYKEKWDQEMEIRNKAYKIAPEISTDPRYVNHVYCFLKSSNLNPSLPISNNRAIDELILKCLKISPDKRYQNFREVKAELLGIYRYVEGREYKVFEEIHQKLNLKMKAKTYWILGREKESLELYEKVTNGNPGDDVAWKEKGIVLAESGRLGEFGTCLDIATYLRPSTEKIINGYRNSVLDYPKLLPRDRRMLDNFSLQYPAYQDFKQHIMSEITESGENYFKEIDPHLSILSKDLNDESWVVRKNAAESLGNIGNPSAIPALIEALKDENEDVCRAAAEALGNIGDSSVIPALRELLKHEDVFVRRDVSKALIKLGDSSGVFALRETLKSEDVLTRMYAAEALAFSGDPSAISTLREVLKDKDEIEEVRWKAVSALGYIKESSVIPDLIEALRNESVSLRDCAARSLGNIGNPSAIPALIEALKDENGDVRRAAAEALGNIGDSSLIPALSQALKDKDSELRAIAAEALTKSGNPSAIPALIEALKDENVFVRRRAVNALGNTGDSSVIPALKEALENNPVCIWTAKALLRLGDPFPISILKGNLRDKSWEVRQEAAKLLGNIGDSSALPALKKLSQDKDILPRMYAVEALGNIGHPAAISTLQEAMRDGNRYVREFAAEALKKLGDLSTTPILIEALMDQMVSVRQLAIKGLRWTFYRHHNSEIEKLKQQLKDYSAFNWNKEGLLFMGVGKADEAIKCFEKAIEIDPDWEEPRKNKEECLKKMT